MNRIRRLMRALVTVLCSALVASAVIPAAQATTPGAPAGQYLSGPWIGESEAYYCGPAAIQTALAHAGWSTYPSQDDIAYETGVYDHLPWDWGMSSAEKAVPVLNKYTYSNAYSYTAHDGNYSVGKFVADVVYSLDRGIPVVLNLRIQPNSPHPPNYPVRTTDIFHYVTIVGYSDYGSTMRISDPAAGGGAGGVLNSYGWGNVPREWTASPGMLAALTWTGYASAKSPGPAAPQVQGPNWPLVVRGQNGSNVKVAQYLLRYHGYSIAADGDFGPATESAVRSFQTAKHIGVDGRIGPQTWSYLIADVSRGSNNDAVRALQTALDNRDYSLAVDGDFGGGTDAAVRSYQSTHGQYVNGVVSGSTWGSVLGTRTISLLARANGEYVTADSGGASSLIANRAAIGPWERFDLVSLFGNDYALVSHADHDLVTADNGGTSALIANRTAIGPWEVFQMIPNADGSVSFMANANRLYVTADNGGNDPLIANRYAVGLWEEFDLS